MANRILLLTCIAMLAGLLFVAAKSLAVTTTHDDQRGTQPSPPGQPARWEYTILDDRNIRQLNALGDQGWEVTQAVWQSTVDPRLSYSGGLILILRRPK